MSDLVARSVVISKLSKWSQSDELIFGFWIRAFVLQRNFSVTDGSWGDYFHMTGYSGDKYCGDIFDDRRHNLRH